MNIYIKETANYNTDSIFWNNHNKIKETSIDILIKAQLEKESTQK